MSVGENVSVVGLVLVMATWALAVAVMRLSILTSVACVTVGL